MIQTSSGKTIVIDGGRSPQQLQEILAALRIDTVDLAILSHDHPDHSAGILSAENILFKEIWIDRFDALSQQTRSQFRGLVADGSKIKETSYLCEHAQMRFGVELEVLWPCEENSMSINDRSLVVRATVAGHRMLFTGDIEAEAESAIGDVGPIDILKVAHHGSRTSSSDAFLRSLGRPIAIISAGRNNRFGHPHREALQRIRRSSGGVFEIAKLGAIEFQLRPAKIWIRSANNTNWRTWERPNASAK